MWWVVFAVLGFVAVAAVIGIAIYTARKNREEEKIYEE